MCSREANSRSKRSSFGDVGPADALDVVNVVVDVVVVVVGEEVDDANEDTDDNNNASDDEGSTGG
jgi:hypothetical protein